MRRALSIAVVSVATAFAVGGLAAPANATCGGGAPGEPCFCPYFIPGLECIN